MEFWAVVEDVRERERRNGRAVWELALSRTEFRPGDRGVLRATARSGTVLEVPVMATEQGADGTVWHVVAKPLAAETEVMGRVEPGADGGLDG